MRQKSRLTLAGINPFLDYFEANYADFDKDRKCGPHKRRWMGSLRDPEICQTTARLLWVGSERNPHYEHGLIRAWVPSYMDW